MQIYKFYYNNQYLKLLSYILSKIIETIFIVFEMLKFIAKVIFF